MTVHSGQPSDRVLAEVGCALERGDIQLALAYHAWREQGRYAATAGLLGQVAPLLGGDAPSRPSQALRALRTARELLEGGRDRFSADTVAYLETVAVGLAAVASDRRARAAEERELMEASAGFDELSQTTGGVFVYTFPHYWWNPSEAAQGLHMLRVGAAPGTREGSIFEQAAAYDMPEEMLVLRFYPAPAGQDPFDLAGRFHEMLDASGHARSQSGDEEPVWFRTDLDTLDLFAYFLGLVGMDDAGLHVISSSAPADSHPEAAPPGEVGAFRRRLRVLLGGRFRRHPGDL